MVARNGRGAGSGTRRADGRRYLTVAVILLTLWVTRSFLIPLAWAAVLAITIWPLHSRAEARWRLPKWALPLIFTIGTGVVLMLPLATAAIEAAQDSRIALNWLSQAQRLGIPQPSWISHVPLAGRDLAAWWQLYLGTPQATGDLLGRLDGGAILGMTGRIGAQVARGSMLFLVTLLALFALLRHGNRLGARADALAAHHLGGLGTRFTDRLVPAVRGTVAGTVLVALGEGTLIGVGYALAGVPRPFLFAVLTIAFAMLPFGAWAIFTLATIVLLANGAILAAALLFGASVAIMLIGDNIVQPALIGNAIKLPFLLALVGTFGGLETFGLVGLFLGPVLMAMLLLIWHEAADNAIEPAPRPDEAGAVSSPAPIS